MNVHIVKRQDVSALDPLLLGSNGRVQLVDFAHVAELPQDLLAQWCQLRGRYTVPTLQLVALLRSLIAGREAETIEICAGAGDLGRLLGIRMTDSYLQADHPELLAAFARLNTPPVKPAADVERLGALQAVEKYRPRVVIAAWATQLYIPGDERPPPVSSSVHGVDELAIWGQVDMYIHIGNRTIHADKRVLRRPNVERAYPFLFSRSMASRENVINIWEPKKWEGASYELRL